MKKVLLKRPEKGDSQLYVNGSFEYNTIRSSFDETGLSFLESITLHGILTFQKFVDFLHEININPGPF